MASKLDSAFARLGAFQTTHPFVVLTLAILSLVPAGWATSQLTLRTAFSELLPDDKPSVIEMRRVEKRLSSASTYSVVVTGGDVLALKGFIDALGPRLRALPKELVYSVDDGTRASRAFIEKHKHLYADLQDIQRIRDEIAERYDYEVGKATGLDLGLDDDAPPPLDVAALESGLAKKVAETRTKEPGTDGYYIGGGKRTIGVMIVNTPCREGTAESKELRRRVAAAVAASEPKTFAPDLEVEYTGSLLTGEETRREITADLASVGVLGVSMILGVVFIFFLRIRTLFCIALTISIGCIWAFGLARYSVGYLNTATGFLVSIIAGNGINFGIMYLARYVEARRDERCSVEESIARAHRDTYTGTFAASLAAMVAYGSLISTDFRGFRHFGLISGGGMVLCWMATYLVLPSILVVSERLRPMYQDRGGREVRLAGLYGYPFAWLSHHAPRLMTVAGVLFGLAGLVLAIEYFRNDPIEYDYRNIRVSSGNSSNAVRLSREVDRLVGRIKQDGKAVLTDRVDQVQPLVAELERRRGLAAPGEEPFGAVVSIYDYFPKDQDKKLPLLLEIRDKLERARARGLIKDAEWARVAGHLPAHLAPIALTDLPEPLARPFTERDGTRGRIVYLAPRAGASIYDMKYVMTWADSFREIRLPNGELIRGTGSPVIYADMVLAIREDGPRAALLSLLGTFAIMLVAFRGRRAGFIAIGTLSLGLAWLAVFLCQHEVRLNFLNFVALPITIGVGADYAINLLKRHEIEGHAALRRTVVETGGAIILCSMTTMAGDFGLLFSINGAVRSYGLLAGMGELSTLVSGLVVLPAALHWAHIRRTARRDPGAIAAQNPKSTAERPDETSSEVR